MNIIVLMKILWTCVDCSVLSTDTTGHYNPSKKFGRKIPLEGFLMQKIINIFCCGKGELVYSLKACKV